MEKLMRSLSEDIEKVCTEAPSKETFKEIKVGLERRNSFRETLKKKETIAKDL